MPPPRAAAAIAARRRSTCRSVRYNALGVFRKPIEALIGVGRAVDELRVRARHYSRSLSDGACAEHLRRLPPPLIALSCGGCSAVGLFIAATAQSFAELVAGYGVLFGIGAGIGFILVQQGVNQR